MSRPPQRLVRQHTVPPRNPQGRREGFTTGTAAAAATKAACLVLLDCGWPETVAVTLPMGRTLDIRINTLEYEDASARCGVVKDAGDDPQYHLFNQLKRIAREWLDGGYLRCTGGTYPAQLIYQDIADSMELSVKAVKSLLSRARVNLKSILEPYMDEGQRPTIVGPDEE